MATYEQKLTLFLQGKRLLCVPRPVRDRADAFCDACGSTQPRTLYPLQELDSGRHYFVGDSYLKNFLLDFVSSPYIILEPPWGRKTPLANSSSDFAIDGFLSIHFYRYPAIDKLLSISIYRYTHIHSM